MEQTTSSRPHIVYTPPMTRAALDALLAAPLLRYLFG